MSLGWLLLLWTPSLVLSASTEVTHQYMCVCKYGIYMYVYKYRMYMYIYSAECICTYINGGCICNWRSVLESCNLSTLRLPVWDFACYCLSRANTRHWTDWQGSNWWSFELHCSQSGEARTVAYCWTSTQLWTDGLQITHTLSWSSVLLHFCFRLFEGQYEPYQSFWSAFISNRKVSVAGEHR